MNLFGEMFRTHHFLPVDLYWCNNYSNTYRR